MSSTHCLFLLQAPQATQNILAAGMGPRRGAYAARGAKITVAAMERLRRRMRSKGFRATYTLQQVRVVWVWSGLVWSGTLHSINQKPRLTATGTPLKGMDRRRLSFIVVWVWLGMLLAAWRPVTACITWTAFQLLAPSSASISQGPVAVSHTYAWLDLSADNANSNPDSSTATLGSRSAHINLLCP